MLASSTLRSPPKLLVVILLMGVLLASPASATIIQGTFSGAVYATFTQAQASLIGLPITGEFSYNSVMLPLVQGGPGQTTSIFSASPSPNPVVISINIGSSVYVVSGTSTSELIVNTNIDAAHPENSFHLRAQNVGVAGIPVRPTDTVLGETVFELSNLLGTPFLSDNLDAGTANFSYSGNTVGEIIFADGSNNGIEFSITSATAGPIGVPEINSFAILASGIAMLIGVLSLAGQRGCSAGSVRRRSATSFFFP